MVEDKKTKFQTLRDLLLFFCSSKTGVFINGIGIGRIDNVHSDFLDFEVVHEEDKKYYKETMHIPIGVITDISSGQREVPKSEVDKNIDKDLGDLL